MERGVGEHRYLINNPLRRTSRLIGDMLTSGNQRFSSKFNLGRKTAYKIFTGIRSNRWTSLSILIGSGNLYPVLQDTARFCREILRYT